MWVGEQDLITSIHFSALWLFFFVIQTASSPLKHFIIAAKIEEARGPFNEKYLYVDKTSHALNLIQEEGRYFFVRPRRFGKSTFLRTLQAIFEGRGRQIFNGTYIHESDYSWDSYPVFYMDLGQDVIEDVETCRELMKTPRSLTLLKQKVDTIFTEFKMMHSLSKPKETRFSTEFRSILKEMKENGNLTVVLIDEYDFSILNNMQSCPPAARINTKLVRNIFLQLKEYAGLIKFAFVTGISKAVFSILGTSFDLNDITDDPKFHNLAGFTKSDLEEYYADRIAEASNYFGKPESNITEELREWFDGYNFTSRVQSSLYNPLSIHSYFQKKDAKGYWTDKDHARFLYICKWYTDQKNSHA